jgi:hypothetical protein
VLFGCLFSWLFSCLFSCLFVCGSDLDLDLDVSLFVGVWKLDFALEYERLMDIVVIVASHLAPHLVSHLVSRIPHPVLRLVCLVISSPRCLASRISSCSSRHPSRSPPFCTSASSLSRYLVISLPPCYRFRLFFQSSASAFVFVSQISFLPHGRIQTSKKGGVLATHLGQGLEPLY